jgi:hypothetical protein
MLVIERSDHYASAGIMPVMQVTEAQRASILVPHDHRCCSSSSSGCSVIEAPSGSINTQIPCRPGTPRYPYIRVAHPPEAARAPTHDLLHGGGDPGAVGHDPTVRRATPGCRRTRPRCAPPPQIWHRIVAPAIDGSYQEGQCHSEHTLAPKGASVSHPGDRRWQLRRPTRRRPSTSCWST